MSARMEQGEDQDHREREPLLPIAGNIQEDSVYDKKAQFIFSLLVCLMPINIGLVLGYSSPAIPDLGPGPGGDDLLPTTIEQSWFGSLIALGAIFGGPVSGFFVDYLGRKPAIMLCGVPMTLGWMFFVVGRHYYFLYLGRLLTGFGMGMTPGCVPLYIAEVASKEYRGMLGAAFQLFITVGILLAYVFGFFLGWQWLAIVSSIFVGLAVLAMLYVPESPRWLLSTGQRVEAIEAMQRIRGSNAVIDDEIMEIEESLHAQAEQGKMSLKDFSQPSLYRPLIISLCLMIFQQLSGINAVIFYSKTIFQKAGFESNPAIPSIIMGTVQVVATAISCLLMDRAGRKILLILAALVMTISSATFGLYYYLTLEKNVNGIVWVSLASLMLYIAAFSIGLGPIPWLVMAEIFPARTTAFAGGISCFLNWSLAFLVTKEFHDLQDAIHPYGAFWLFGGICFLAVVFVIVFMPETKGKSLEEIERHFTGRVTHTE